MLRRLIEQLRSGGDRVGAADVRPRATGWPPPKRRRKRGARGTAPAKPPRVRELLVSVDVEADGPVPGLHSMLSIGAAAFDLGADDPLEPIATWEANLLPLAGATEHPKTMAWWERQEGAWAALQADRRDPAEALPEFLAWTQGLPGAPVFCGYPAAFDFMWVRWYLERFCGTGGPFPFAALDVRTLAMDRLGLDYRDVRRDRFPEHWRDEGERERTDKHVALADALVQGRLLVRILRETRTGPDAGPGGR